MEPNRKHLHKALQPIGIYVETGDARYTQLLAPVYSDRNSVSERVTD